MANQLKNLMEPQFNSVNFKFPIFYPFHYWGEYPSIFDPIKYCKFLEESYNKDTAWAAFHYSYYVIRGRWKAGESQILKDPRASACYAYYIIHKSWDRVEEQSNKFIKRYNCTMHHIKAPSNFTIRQNEYK